MDSNPNNPYQPNLLSPDLNPPWENPWELPDLKGTLTKFVSRVITGAPQDIASISTNQGKQK